MYKRFLYLTIAATIFSIICYNFVDLNLAIYFHSLNNIFIKKSFKLITKLGQSEYFLIPCFALFVFLKLKKDKRYIKPFYIFVCVAISGIFVDIIKVIMGRCRPELYFDQGRFGFDFFRLSSEYLSFPSGHSATAFSAMTGLSVVYPKFRYLFLLIGTIIALSRVVVTAHYISDIIIGSLIGYMISIVFYHKFFKDRFKDVD